jgi:hypothetical protein
MQDILTPPIAWYAADPELYHVRMGIVMQEYGTVGEFTWMFVFELGTQLLKYL